MMLAYSNLCIFATDGHELISVQFIYTVAAYLRAALSQEPPWKVLLQENSSLFSQTLFEKVGRVVKNCDY